MRRTPAGDQLIQLPWYPQPRQRNLFEAAGLAPIFDGGAPVPPVARAIGYGGSAGGGKTDADIGLAIAWAIAYPQSMVGFFRRKFTDLEGPDGAILRSKNVLAEAELAGVCAWNGTDHAWRFRNGSMIKFCHCKTEATVYDYQSQGFDLLIIDEATHFTWFMVDYLMTRNRPTQDWIPHSLAVFTTNPGNVGHLWFKSQYVGYGSDKVVDALLPSNKTEKHIFIRSRLDDNPILDNRGNHEYRHNLETRDEKVRKALLDGNWDIFEGQVFSTWNYERHTCDPFEIPLNWTRWRGIDWGYRNPWCCLWFAKDPNRGRIFCYRELYQTLLTDPQQARAILDNTAPGEVINMNYADPSMWTAKTIEERVVSSADVYNQGGVHLLKADNNRMMGKRKIDDALADLPDGLPGLVVFRTCTNFIRTLPALVYDPVYVEDVDTAGEDHAYDAARYGLTPIVINRKPKESTEPLDPILKMLKGRGQGMGGKDF